MNKERLINLLKDELVMAMGCTEPLALAYAGSLARHYLEEEPKKVYLEASTNIYKNVRAVTLPNKIELKGVKASTLLGVFGGDHTKGFACIDNVGDKYEKDIKNFIENNLIEVKYIQMIENLYINLTLYGENDEVNIKIKENHLNVVEISKNSEVLFKKKQQKKEKEDLTDLLKFENIYEFSKNVDIKDIEDIIATQYKYNLDISLKGMDLDLGVSIGKMILKNNDSLWGKVKAYTASGSEARMCGSMMPVIINSGSGNQGLSSSVPIIIYGKEEKYELVDIYRALVFANLLTIKQKVGIGSLSAYCGIVASCGSAGAGITFLAGGTYEQLVMTMKNYLATVPGIICDGAKASCASKITTALDGAILAHQLAMENKQYEDNSGIIKEDIDETIEIISDIASKGMRQTDAKIIEHLK